MTTQEILALLENVKEVSNNEWCANCPACNDTKRHLYIHQQPNMTLLDCKKGCTWDSIMNALNIEKKEIYIQKPKERWETLRTHEYTSKDGNKIARKTIYRKSNGSKTAIWHRYEGNTLVKGLNGLKMPLYHIGNLTDKSKPIFLVEGEKDVETLESMEFISTTSPNGAGSHWKKEFNNDLKGFDIIILADNDEIGLKYATEIANNILKIARSVKLVPSQKLYEPLKQKGDISDIAEEIGKDRTKQLLENVIKSNDYLFIEDTFLQEKSSNNTHTLLGLDDTGNAELFVSLFQDKVRYNYVRGRWLIYNEKNWEFVHDDDIIGNLVDETLEHMYNVILPHFNDPEKYIKHLEKTRSFNGRNNMLKISRHKLSIKPTDIDKDNYLFNVQNGTLDLKKCTFRPHNHKDYITKIANVTYDGNAHSILWEKVISDAMCEDIELIKFIQRVLGYSLVGENPEECFFIFHGNTTRNGKSTILETTSYLMGDGYSVSVAPSTFIERNVQGANPELLAIKGARLMFCGELRADAMLNDTLLKMITGNDTLSARALYGDVETFKCTAKLIANTNGLPPLRNNDLIKSGRVYIIPFNRHFKQEERIKNLKERLREPQELSGILNWLLNGLKEYQKIGLAPPESVINIINQYQHDNDKIQLFFEECMYRIEDENTPVSKIYPIYKDWCEMSGYKALGKQQFYEKLKERPEYVEKARCKSYNNQTYNKVIRGFIINRKWYQ